jgi:hypothetical protein
MKINVKPIYPPGILVHYEVWADSTYIATVRPITKGISTAPVGWYWSNDSHVSTSFPSKDEAIKDCLRLTTTHPG